MKARRTLLLLVLGSLAVSACRERETPPAAPSGSETGGSVLLTEVTQRSGVDFQHFTGATGEKYLPETLASGVCAFDYDGDHRTDLYFVNGAPLGKGRVPSPPPTDHLYRNRGDGTFEDVTAASHTGDPGYGIGCAVGDVDGDGWEDLYVANFGVNTLYRNRGDGTFEDITASSGTGDPSFSTGAAFVDVDADGDLDLYVVNYMDYRIESNKYCGELKEGYRAYCGPEMYPGSPDRLYRNEGGGRFKDVSQDAGIADPEGRGLGIVALDFDRDGDMDIFVANDGMANYLYVNDGKGRFTETAFASGVALGDEGRARSGMGTDAGDYDGDGWQDLFVANLSYQPSSLFRNNGDGTFSERSFPAGIAGPTQLMTGYGAGFFDFDNDGWLDLFQANGSMLDNVQLYFDNLTYPEPAQIFRNRGNGTFEETTATLAPDLARPCVGRGSAILDLDADGNLDLVVSVAGGKARVFRNRGVPGRYLEVLLEGKRSNREGYGALLTLTVGGRKLTRAALSSSGYASQSERSVHFGLGSDGEVELLEVRWPSGQVDRIASPGSNRIVRVVEGSGKAEAVRLGR